MNRPKPAFPTSYYGEQNDDEAGMTLRDYFAAKAMQGELASQTDENQLTNWAGLAKRCYGIADAMLAAREVQS